MKFWTVQKITVADTVNKFSMPPLMIMPPYGIIRPSVFPSGLIQAHLPYIKSENITNIYPMFKLK